MLKQFLLIIISTSISASKFEPEFCDHKYFTYRIPGGPIGEALNLLSSGGIRNKFECHNYQDLPFTQQDFKYRLYTRTNESSDWLVLTTDNLINLDRSKPTKIILPGWLCGDQQIIVQKLIRNFLHRYDCNVITIDHRKMSFKYYKRAVCNIKKAAELFGDFLCELKLDYNRVHVLGHSLGAQLAGQTGRRMKAKCNVVIDRITGLDPAGPIYQRMDRTQQLSKEDARFVDVIHSNMGIYGYYGPIGHVDFYPFGGLFQSNCIKTKQSFSTLDLLLLPPSLCKYHNASRSKFLADLLSGQENFFSSKKRDLIIKTIILIETFLDLCSHKRAVEYFADSILGPKSMFQAKSCTLTPKHLPIGTCLSDDKPQYNIMGEDCERNSSATEFVWRSSKSYALMNG